MTRRLALHACALWCVLFAATWVVDVDSAVFDADEGALLMQVQSLADTGDWWIDDPGADIDPEGQFFGIIRARVADGEALPFPARPLFVLANTAMWELGGVRGATLLGITGVAIGAWAAGRLTTRIDERAALLALWLAGLASPLGFQSLILQGHGLVVGLGALALVVVVEAGEARSRTWLLAVAAALVSLLAASMRREIALMAVATLVAATIAAIRRREIRSVVVALAATGGTGLGLVLDHLVMTRMIDLEGKALTTTGIRSGFLTDRLNSISRFILPGFLESDVARVLAFVAAAVCIVVAVRFVQQGNMRELLGGAAIASALLLARLVVDPTPVIPGLLPAFPLGAAALILGIRTARSDEVARLLAIAFVIFVGLTGATQYPFGGGFEWGSRYLSVGLVAAMPVCAAGLMRVWDEIEDVQTRRLAVGVVAILALAPPVMGLAAQRHARSTNAANIAAGYDLAATLGVDVVASTHSEIPRVNTRYFTEGIPWFEAQPAHLPDFVTLLDAAGYDEVPLFTRTPEITIARLDGTGWSWRQLESRPENPGRVGFGILERDE